jgi:hypothetical protein
MAERTLLLMGLCCGHGRTSADGARVGGTWVM